MKKMICILLLFFVLFGVIGCTIGEEKSTIKSEKEAKQTVLELSNDLTNLSTGLDSLNKQLG